MRTPRPFANRFTSTAGTARGGTLLLIVIVAGVAYWAGLRKGQVPPAAEPPRSVSTSPQAPVPVPTSSTRVARTELTVPETLEFASLKLLRSSPTFKEWSVESQNIVETFSMNVKIGVFDAREPDPAGRPLWIKRAIEDMIVAKRNRVRKDENRGHIVFIKDWETQTFSNGPLIEVRRSILFGEYSSMLPRTNTLPPHDAKGVFEYMLHGLVSADTGTGYLMESERTRRGLFGTPGVPVALDDLRETLNAPRLDSPSKGISSSGSGRGLKPMPMELPDLEFTNRVFFGEAVGVGDGWMSGVSIGTFNPTGMTNEYYCYISTKRMQVLLRELAPDERPDREAANLVAVDSGLWNARSRNVVLISHRGELEAAQGMRAELRLRPLE